MPRFPLSSLGPRFLVLLSSGLFGVAGIAQESGSGQATAGPARLRRVLETAFLELDTPGVSAAFARDGKIVWAMGVGRRSATVEAAAAPVGPRTLFQAASISKSATAVAVLRLCDQGVLDLSTPLAELPGQLELPIADGLDAAAVDLRRLLSHSAGVTVHGFPGYAVGGDVPTLDGVLAGRGNTPRIEIDVAPGSTHRYSGGGYCVVQSVLTAVDDRSFAELLHEEVLEPAGMRDSSFVLRLPKALEARAARAHDAEGKILDVRYHVYPEQAAAGMWTTPSDLLRLVIAVESARRGGAEKPLLKRETANAMLSTQAPAERYGIGFQVMRKGNQAMFGHSGANRGFLCDVRHWRQGDKTYALAVMINSERGADLWRVVRALRAAGMDDGKR